MTVQIHPISFGFVSVFLLKGEKTVLIDAGAPGQIERFLDGLAMTGTQPGEIDLLLLTHGHFDHIGLAKEIVRPKQPFMHGRRVGSKPGNHHCHLVSHPGGNF